MSDVDISPQNVELIASAYDCDPATEENQTAGMLRALSAALTATQEKLAAAEARLEAIKDIQASQIDDGDRYVVLEQAQIDAARDRELAIVEYAYGKGCSDRMHHMDGKTPEWLVQTFNEMSPSFSTAPVRDDADFERDCALASDAVTDFMSWRKTASESSVWMPARFVRQWLKGQQQ